MIRIPRHMLRMPGNMSQMFGPDNRLSPGKPLEMCADIRLSGDCRQETPGKCCATVVDSRRQSPAIGNNAPHRLAILATYHRCLATCHRCLAT